ncbi:MAG TPA: hypothetical protein VFW71_13765 [Actinomycetota bacterium]|nr:hypothetical protein [Actinomycetota bacterium]
MICLRQRIKGAFEDDEGSALLLALIFIIIIAVGLGALLYMGDASIRTTLAVRDQSSTTYGVDGAVNGAINSLRHARDASGVLLGTAPAYATPVGTNNCPTSGMTIDGVSATVTCVGTNDSGLVSQDNTSNDPSYALLALETVTGTVPNGVLEKSNYTLTIGGKARSNNNIDLKNAVFWNVTGSVSTPSCLESASTNISATGGLNCADNATVFDPGYVTSTYDPLLTSTVTPAASQCISGATYFFPGWYTNVNQLNAAGPCASNGKAIFTTGVYFFNFSTGNPAHLWAPSFSQMIGGTPNAAGSAATDCLAGQPGVQWVFGGDSHMRLDNALNACPIISLTRQQIVLYGLPPRYTVTYTASNVESGCVANQSCYLLDASAASTQLVLRGTVYAPVGSFNVKLVTSSTQAIFGRGIICDDLTMDLTGGAGPLAGVIGTPPILGTSTKAGPRTVLFTATVGGKTKLKAIAQYDDTDSSNPGKQVTVTAWSYYR